MLLINAKILLLTLVMVKCKKKFPLMDFFNVSIVENFDNYYFAPMIKEADDHLCSQVDSGTFSECCGCSESCLEKVGRCCVDALWNEETFQNMSSYRKHLIEQVHRKMRTQGCENVFPYAKNENKYSGVMYTVYNKCRRGATQMEQERCSTGGDSIRTSIPVFDEHELLYKNLYCAVCNSVEEFRMASIAVTCDNSVYSDLCSYLLLFEKSINYECVAPYKEDCDTSNKYYSLCKTFTHPFGSYKNFFCYLCQNEKVYRKKGMWSKYIGCHPFLSWAHMHPKKMFYPKFYTLNSDGLQSGVEETSLDKLLDKTSDNFHICPHNYTEVIGKCVKDPLLIAPRGITDFEFDQCFLQHDITIFIVNNSIRGELKLVDNFLGTGISKDIFTKVNDASAEKTVLRTTTRLNESDINEILNHVTRIKNYLRNNEILVLNPTTSHVNNTNLFQFAQIFPRNQICHSPVDIDVDEYIALSEQCNVTTAKGETFESDELSFWIEITNETVVRHLSYCKNFYLSTEECPLRLINSTATTVHLENHTLVHTRNDNKTEMFEVTEYIRLGKNMYGVCVPIHDAVPIHHLIKGYSTITFCMLSLLYYIFVILSHFFRGNKKLNFIGSCTLQIYIWLLVSDIFFLLDNFLSMLYKNKSYQEYCDFIGPLNHLLVLIVQIGGVLLAFNVRKKLTLGINTDERCFRKEMIVYHILVFLPSLIIVIIELFLYKGGRESINDMAEWSCHHRGDILRNIIFSYIPTILAFVTSTSILLVGLNRVSRVLNNDQSNTKYKKPLFALVLIFICTVSDGLGYIEIQNGGMIRIFYSTVRALRGIMFCILQTIARRSSSDVVVDT